MVARTPIRSTLPYLLFAALVIVFLWKPIFTGQALLPGDYLAQMHPWRSVIKPIDPPPQWNPLQWDAIAQFYPWRAFYAKWMGQGIIPLWNPHQFCGTPFLANGQSAVLYPLNLVFLLFDPITALTVYAALHLLLAAAFTYLLLRELGCRELGGIVGGITFAFCAFMVRWLELPTFVGAAVWLPLSLFLVHRAVERRSVFYGMLSGLTIALAFLAGHLQIAFYVLLASVLWWAWKLGQVWRSSGRATTFFRVVVPCAGCLAILALIASAQLLPSIELARNSHRSGGPTAEGYEWFIGNSLKAYYLVTAFIPDFYGSPATNNFMLLGRLDNTRHVASAADYMEYGLYAGVLPLMLALIGLGSIRKPHVGFFALLSGLALLCALGTPINWPLYHLVPGFSAMGGPNRILLLYLFGIAGLAAFGMDAMMASDVPTTRSPQRSARMMPVMFGIAAFALALALSLPIGMHKAHELVEVTVTADALWAMASPVLAVTIWGACCVILLLRYLGSIALRTCSALLMLALTADLFAAGINYNPTCDRSKVYPRTELTDKLQKIARNERIAPINPTWSLFETPDAILPPNSAMVYGLYDVQGYDSLYTRAYKDGSSRWQGEDSSPIENGNMVVVKRPQEHSSLFAGVWVLPPDRVLPVADSLPVAWREDQPLSSDGRELGGRVRVPTPGLSNPNRVSFPIDISLHDHYTLAVYALIPDYPGWIGETATGIRLPMEWNAGMVVRATMGNVSDKEPDAEFRFDPLSFRLGLFLMLTGIGALSCVGTFRLVRRGQAKR